MQMKILGFGTYNKASHPRVGILLDGLAAHGHEVRELNRPLDIGTAGRVNALSSGSARLRFAGDLLKRWISLVKGARSFRGANKPDVIIVGYLGHFDVLLARLLFPRTPIALDLLVFGVETARDRGTAITGINGMLLRLIDRMALRLPNLIVVDTEPHRNMVPERLRRKAVVALVGAPDSWFAAREDHDVQPDMTSISQEQHDAPAGRLSVVFYGLFTPLQGTPVIADALAELESRGVALDVTLIGKGQDYEECRDRLANVHDNVHVQWMEWVQTEELPQIVAAHDICLGIFGTSDKAFRVVPNKAYQGMAAGCAMVTSDTPVQREVLADGARFVPAGDPVALADVLEEFACSPRELAAARCAAARRADEAFHADRICDALEERLR